MATSSDLPPPYQPETHSTGSCPNSCETGALTQGQLKDHMLDCPLQTVECDLPGCDVKVLRRDLAKHMTENAQQHLLSATLLNLRLTRELHQKMEEKDKQIEELQKRVDKLSSQVDLNGFVCHSLELKDFKFYQQKTATGEWLGPIVSDGLGFLKIQLQINTNGDKVKDRHLSVSLIVSELNIGSKSTNHQYTGLHVSLQMLNRLGDYGHHVVLSGMNVRIRQLVSFDKKYFPLDGLGFDSSKETQYLKDDSIHFKLYFKTADIK